jgi:hypothetical protein
MSVAGRSFGENNVKRLVDLSGAVLSMLDIVWSSVFSLADDYFPSYSLENYTAIGLKQEITWKNAPVTD